MSLPEPDKAVPDSSKRAGRDREKIEPRASSIHPYENFAAFATGRLAYTIVVYLTDYAALFDPRN